MFAPLESSHRKPLLVTDMLQTPNPYPVDPRLQMVFTRRSNSDTVPLILSAAGPLLPRYTGAVPKTPGCRSSAPAPPVLFITQSVRLFMQSFSTFYGSWKVTVTCRRSEGSALVIGSGLSLEAVRYLLQIFFFKKEKRKTIHCQILPAPQRFQTQVPCLVGGCGFRFRTHELLSLQSKDFCCDMSMRALAMASPDCPGGGTPANPLGRQRKTVRTAALFPEHGSMAIGFGTPSTGPRRNSVCSAPPTSSVTSTEANGRLAICCRSRISCSLRRDAQQVCLIFQTTAATRSSDKKQLKKVTKNCTKSMMVLCWEKAIWILIGHEKLLT